MMDAYMKKTITALFLTMAIIPSTAFADAKNSKCLEYEPKTVRVSGVIRPQIFAGPPEFSNVEEGDEPLLYWILHLDEPICVNESPMAPVINFAERNIKNLHLIVSDADNLYTRSKNLLGENVVLTGSLFHRITVWHKTKALIIVYGIALNKNKI
ncbi:hypothetical protein MNBD_NITROSPINAE04-1724 [hydrothermal vent metagenome]|uniref:DUF4431 domain-containing protein n=1 Tax=hydrothermal vent metagenome TaxID=652676 RepID=A0A3B1BJM7_9ZZZZ